MKLKHLFVALIILLTSINLAYAHGEDFTEAQNIIASKVACDKLSNEQLELIGDYYMEQMHPGEAHEMMDKMMGGEGSENLRQMHIMMSKRLYCNEETGGMMNSGSMMGMMNLMGSGGMMNMMDGNIMGGGMMGTNAWWFFGIIWLLFWIAVLTAIIMLIIWLYKKLISENSSSLDVLKKRYAKGELTKKEYESMKKEISD